MGKPKPTVSVLMGVYNAAPTLAKAIDSILGQTMPDLEFIICDDGSTDNGSEIISRYCEQDNRVIALKNEKNIGLAASLNKCLELATGEYIARQDADDISLPDRLEKTLAFLKETASPYVGCGVYVFDDKSVWSKRLFPERIDQRIIAQYNPFFHPTMIFKYSVLLAVNGYRVAEETRRLEDYDLVMRLAAKNIIGRNLQEYLYYVYEPIDAYLKHNVKTRLAEIKVRLRGLRAMQSPPRDYLYLAKPLILSIIPRFFMRTVKKWQWRLRSLK